MRAQAQYTIYTLNDVQSGETAPASPYLGQLWVDTSTSPPITRVWNGAEWVELNGTDKIKDEVKYVTDKQNDFEQSAGRYFNQIAETTSRVETVENDLGEVEEKYTNVSESVTKLEQTSKEITASVESVKKTSDEALKEAKKNSTDLTNYASQVNGSLTDLQNQIDGAIETWFYNYVPTTANAPASSWTTTEDKNKHLGDLFYIVDNAEKGGLVYRWALVNGVYGWILVEDTEVAKALETASQAKDTADGKRRVFVAQPKPPYDVGDLWTNNTDLYVCQTARAAGNYTASDWKLATKYTTETAVQALIKVATDSITLRVESVENGIDTINKEISTLKVTAKGVDMVSEDSNGKLVSFIGNRDGGGAWEAKYTKNGAVTSALYFDFPANEFVFTGAIKGGSININDRFKVDALGNVTLPDNASISWGQVYNKPTNLATTDDIPSDDHITQITEDTVRTSNVVAQSLHVKAANIDGTLTARQIDISVGGRNYLPNSSFTQNFNGWYKVGSPEITTIDGVTCGHFIGGLRTEKLVSRSIPHGIDTNDLSQTYVFSADIRLDNFVAGTTSCYVALYLAGTAISGEWMGADTVSGDEYLDRFNNKGWVRVYRCVKFAKKPSQMDAFIYAQDFTGDLYFKNVKFERGNKPTDWTPAIEDTEATVTKITNDTISTTNVVAQNLRVKAANIEGALTFGDGSYYIDPSATTTYLSLPGITVDKNGTTVEGKLVTTAGGYVGGFFVDEHQLDITTNTKGNLCVGRYGLLITEPSVNDYRLFFASVDEDKVYAKNLCIKDATSYNINISSDKILFVSGNAEIGRIETYATYVDIKGTWRTNGSAWISRSDARLKNTIEDFTPAHDILFDNLRPRTYKWNEGTSDRTHSGFIVQEVVEAVEKAGLTTKDFAAVVNFKGENGEDSGWGLRYEEMISLNTWQIQKLKARVAELEKKLEAIT